MPVQELSASSRLGQSLLPVLVLMAWPGLSEQVQMLAMSGGQALWAVRGLELWRILVVVVHVLV